MREYQQSLLLLMGDGANVHINIHIMPSLVQVSSLVHTLVNFYICRCSDKYCSVCAHSLKHNTEPQKHDCYKNWDGPSSSMETDILVQGFKEAETKYGLRYTTFTGDGDSSVHTNLVTQVPGWGHVIRKVECANHAVKCYRGALERLVMEKPHYKERQGEAYSSHAKASDYCSEMCYQDA